MDEGLRLARMVSHDRAGKMSLGSEETYFTGDFSSNDLTMLKWNKCLFSFFGPFYINVIDIS